MPDFAPIRIQAVDNDGGSLFDFTVPYEFEMSVKQLLERAFVMGQVAQPDPFSYTLEYYGYGDPAKFPVYFGYEIESIGLPGKPPLQSNTQLFWSLSVNGVASDHGADTTFPVPGSTVLWTYTPVPPKATEAPGRAGAIHRRRAARRTNIQTG